MRILLITQGVSRIVQPVISTGHEIVGILESMPRDFSGVHRRSIVFDFLSKAYYFFKNKKLSLGDFCTDNKIPYNIIWRGNQSEVRAWVEELSPDLVVVFSMSQLLKNEILEIPRLGVINLHPSFLPSYRGANPDFWQYYDMEMTPGVTVHYVNAGEDTGDIIYQEKMHIPLGTKSPVRLDKLIGELGTSLVLKAINAIARGDAPRTPQPAQSTTARARNLKLEEHTQIIDWENWPIERVWHVLRGTELWLNAITQPSGLMAGQRWSIYEYEKITVPPSGLGNFGALGEYNGRACIFARDGVIYIGIEFDIKKAVLTILQK